MKLQWWGTGFETRGVREGQAFDSSAFRKLYSHFMALSPEQFDVVPGHRGREKHLSAMAGGQQIGRLEYSVHKTKGVKIRSIWTDEEHRRQGVASGLMDDLRQRHAGQPIDPGDFTQMGAAWWEASQKDR